MKILSSKIAKNFTSLATINFINLSLPLVTIPYLLSVLGVTNYGVMAFHQYLGQFFLVLFEFGFPLYGVSEIARRTGEPEQLGRFMADACLIKIAVLAIVLLGAAAVWAIFQDSLRETISLPLLFLFTLAAAVTSFAPSWFLQGLDVPHVGIIPTFIGRIATLATTLLLVQSDKDVLLTAIPHVAGAFVLVLLMWTRAVKWMQFSGFSRRNELQRVAKESINVFWSRLMILGYVTVSPILINLAAGSQGVTVYNLCEKAITVARMPFDMFAGASYARFSRDYDKRLARKFLIPLGVGGIIAACLLIVASKVLVGSISFPNVEVLSDYLPIYALALVPISMHGFIGTCSLLANGKRFELTQSIITGLITYVAFVGAFYEVVEDKIILSILGMVLVEAGICLSRIFFAIRHRLI